MTIIPPLSSHNVSPELVELYIQIVSLKENLEALQSKAEGIFFNVLEELNVQAGIDVRMIRDVFYETIGLSTKNLLFTLSKSAVQGLASADIYLFEGAIADNLIKVLESVLAFVQMVDEEYPASSEKIIDALEIVLLGVISTYLPMVGLVLKFTHILEGMKNSIQVENLLPKAREWRKQINKIRSDIQADKRLGAIYKKAQSVSAFASEVGMSPIVISQLNLASDELQKITEEEQKKGGVLKAIINVVDSIPTNKNTVKNNITQLRDRLIKCIEDVDPESRAIMQKIISKRLNQTEKELINVVQSKTSAFGKISSCCSAYAELIVIPELIKEEVAPSKTRTVLQQRIKDCIERERSLIVPTTIASLQGYLSPKFALAIGLSKIAAVAVKYSDASARSRG